MSAPVSWADAVADKLAELLDQTDKHVADLCEKIPAPQVTLKDAKRAASELRVVMDHAEKHVAQLQALQRMGRDALRRLEMDIAMVEKRRTAV